MSKTFACLAGCEDREDIAVFFTPENHKQLLQAAHDMAVHACRNLPNQPGAFAVVYWLHADAVYRGDEIDLDPDDTEMQRHYEWIELSEQPALDADLDSDQYRRVECSKIVCDGTSFHFEIRLKDDTEYQTDYFRWADLPEGILQP